MLQLQARNWRHGSGVSGGGLEEPFLRSWLGNWQVGVGQNLKFPHDNLLWEILQEKWKILNWNPGRSWWRSDSCASTTRSSRRCLPLTTLETTLSPISPPALARWESGLMVSENRDLKFFPGCNCHHDDPAARCPENTVHERQARCLLKPPLSWPFSQENLPAQWMCSRPPWRRVHWHSTRGISPPLSVLALKPSSPSSSLSSSEWTSGSSRSKSDCVLIATSAKCEN